MWVRPRMPLARSSLQPEPAPTPDPGPTNGGSVATDEIAQDDLLERCERELAKVDEEAGRLAGELSEEQLRWSPPDGGWSVAQVFAHLAIANGSYLEGIRTAIARERQSGARRQRETWKPTFFGGLLIRSQESSSRRSMPSPRLWRPSAVQPTGALEAFLDSQRAVASLVREARGIDLMRARLLSPVSRLIRLNVGDAFSVLAAHDWRHLGQVRRILALPGFPRRQGTPAQQ